MILWFVWNNKLIYAINGLAKQASASHEFTQLSHDRLTDDVEQRSIVDQKRAFGIYFPIFLFVFMFKLTILGTVKEQRIFCSFVIKSSETLEG